MKKARGILHKLHSRAESPFRRRERRGASSRGVSAEREATMAEPGHTDSRDTQLPPRYTLRGFVEVSSFAHMGHAVSGHSVLHL